MTSMMGGDNVKISASTRAEIIIFALNKKVLNSCTIITVIDRETDIIQESIGF